MHSKPPRWETVHGTRLRREPVALAGTRAHHHLASVLSFVFQKFYRGFYVRWLMSKFHDLSMTSITGEAVPFARFDGQACLVVNLASK